MSLTPSTMPTLGITAPDFQLQDVKSFKTVSLADFADKKALLVIFMCQHCPYVKHVEGEIAKIGRDYQEKDLGIVAISSNDSTAFPDDTPEYLKEQAERLGFVFPYLHDESQEAAKSYKAACTPDFFLYDSGRKLVYRGQLDDSRPGNGKPVTGKDLRLAIDAVLDSRELSVSQFPSTGCNIKWKE